MFSDVGPMELITLAMLAVLLFGPDKLPGLIQEVASFLRKVRQFSDSAKEEIRSELGPEFKDFEFEDLHPKALVRKRVLEGGDGLGLDEIRGALDPRREISELSDAVRAVADAEPESPPAQTQPQAQTQAGPTAVRLEKAEGGTAPRSLPYDPEVT